MAFRLFGSGRVRRILADAHGYCVSRALPAHARLQNEFAVVAKAKGVEWVMAQPREVTIEINVAPEGGKLLRLRAVDRPAVDGAELQSDVGREGVGRAVGDQHAANGDPRKAARAI